MNKNLLLLLSIFFIVGCVNNSYGPDVVKRFDAQKQQYVVLGTIIDITEVTIEGDRELGATAGAIIGGVAGKNVTESEPESDIASLLGGLVGSAIGSEVGSNLTRKDGIELLIETDSGRLLSIIQEISAFTYSKNQRVRIIKRNGKSRVVPFE
jgi:outer membrane lipoprotein SlyB